MKKCAVLGTGSIGSLVGGYLSHAGIDLTMVTAFRRDKAEFLNRTGLHMTGPGEVFHTPVKAAFLDDLAADEAFDIVFLAVKSNDLENVIPRFLPHLIEDGCFVTLENGINEELVASLARAERVVAGTTFAGGHMIAPDHLESHEGHFYVGELNGRLTDRVREIAGILSCCRPAEATEHIRTYQWDKLARVCLSVPCACISGLHLGSVFIEPRLQKLFALLALELFAVSKADGSPLDTVEEKSEQEWTDVLEGRLTGLEGRTDDWPPGITDAYTSDIQKGRPLEIGFTNGAVVRLGRRYDVPTPMNECVMNTVFAIEAGKETRGFHNVERALALAGITA